MKLQGDGGTLSWDVHMQMLHRAINSIAQEQQLHGAMDKHTGEAASRCNG
jgi:hypothetical protein